MKQSSLLSNTKSSRQGNFELLRIIAAFMVLIVHANFGTIGEVNSFEFSSNPLSAFSRTILQVISTVSVNLFILISGWFGIKPTFRGACNFIFQWWFYLIGLGIFGALLTFSQDLENFKLYIVNVVYSHKTYGWFCVAYITLYIMSPILNAWIKQTSKREFTIILLGIFSLSFVSYIGWCGAFNGGYSAIGLISIYLLGRYLSLYLRHWSKYGFGIWLTSVSLSLCHYVHPISLPYMDLYLGSYNNPLVICASAGLVLWFSRISIPMNRLIAFMSSSCFSIYIIHTHPAILERYFQPLILWTYNYSSGINKGLIFGLTLFAVYLFCACVDKLRIKSWVFFQNIIFNQNRKNRLNSSLSEI